MDADPGNSIESLTSSSAETSFLLKLDAAGNLIWAQQYDNIYISDIEIRSNAVYCGGNFSGPCDFDVSAATNILTSQDNVDCFVMRLNTDGELQWVKGFGSSANTSNQAESVTSINITPGGGINVSGVFSDSGDFNPEAGQTLLNSTGASDVFILQFNATGTFQWAVNAGSGYGVYGAQIVTTSTGAIYQTNSTEVSLSGEPYEDISIRKFSSGGTLLWSKHIGGNFMDQVSGITTDEDENLYISGDFGSESVDFDPGSGETIIQCNGMESINGYLVKFTPAGNLEWVTPFSGNPNAMRDIKYHSGFVYTTGCFFESLDFAPGEDYQYIIQANPPFPNGFVSKLDVTETLGLADETAENGTLFKLYPNPTQSEITIQTEQLKQGSIVKIYDLTGALMLEQVMQQPTTVLNIQQLASGTYLVELHQDNEIAVQRLIKD
jgi:outer membrane protein assembly factor BamB